MNEFSDIAFAKLLQVSPELSSFIVTFSDMTDEMPEDSGINAGAFVLRAGLGVFFIPAIAKDGSLFPIDSIFSNEKKKFFPLTKNLVNDLIMSATASLGASTRIPQTVVQNPDISTLVNPPRTGKYSYASSGARLTGFLASMPDDLKNSVRTKLLADQSTYNHLHQMFDLSDILAALKPTVDQITAEKPVVRIVTEGNDLSPDEITSILNEGFAVRGIPQFERIAIPKQHYENLKSEDVRNESSWFAVDIAMGDGGVKTGYLPPFSDHNITKGHNVVLFEDGTYHEGTTAVVSTGERNPNAKIDDLFKWTAPVLLKDIQQGDRFALFDDDHKLIGIFGASRVMHSAIGQSIYCNGRYGQSEIVIRASRNIPAPILANPGELWVKTYTPVLKLKGLSSDLECSVNKANDRWNLKDLGLLQDSLDLRFDGVEYSVDGKVIGDQAKLAHRLIVVEHIAPNIASSLIKQASEQKRLTVCMTKKADAEIPTYGEPPVQQTQQGTGLPGSQAQGVSFNPSQSLTPAFNMQDQQAVEATIISELLQCPDMGGYISEYMPDIEECIDKLGRTLFLCRVHSGKMAERMDPESLTSLTTNLRGVYRNLGETYLKLSRTLALGFE